MKRGIYYFLILVFSCTGIYSGWNIYKIRSEYAKGEDSYKELEVYIKETQDDVTVMNDENGAGAGTKNSDDSGDRALPVIDFTGLKAVNEDIVGWIYIPDTKINYPIVQAEDNEYYLYRLFDGTGNASGSIFMDMRNHSDFRDDHTIIYGHHMKNGTMFAGLEKYQEEGFFKTHPKGYILTEEGNFEIRIFAGHVANVLENAWNMEWDDDEKKGEWIKEQVAKSEFDSGIVPVSDDNIITLSTCSYEFDDARFVVSGIIRPID